jgi:hypothetical protein
VAAPADPRLQFDLSASTRAAALAASSGGSVSVAFRVEASSGGTSVSLPGAGDAALRYYVADAMPPLRIPAVPFGRVSGGKLALYLPWGSGPLRAGLAPGAESATIGPSSFDVDRRGRIYLADPLQHRVTVFHAGRVVRQSRLALSPRTDLALADDGTAYLASSPVSAEGRVTVRAVDLSGRLVASERVGSPGDIASEIRTSRGRPWVHLLPLDAWVPADASAADRPLASGRPLAGGTELLKVIRTHALRLGLVSGGAVTDALELTSPTKLGEVALAEPDGLGGYLAIIHTWRDGRRPADQYQVVHVRADRRVTTFAAPHEEFAETMPLSTFRLGQDGGLYEMRSGADGLRIYRYDIGGSA